MKSRQFQRSPAAYRSRTARTPRLLNRMGETAFARWAHRKGDSAMDAVPAIEDQLDALRPICTIRRVATGITCGAPAVAVAELHAIDECDQLGLSPDGDVVETLCQECLSDVQWLMATYVGLPGVHHLRASHWLFAQCLRCPPTRAPGAGGMTGLRNVAVFVAVVAGDYAVLVLIYGQLIEFGVGAAVCMGSTLAAGLIANTDRRRRKAMARRRAAVWERRDQQAATADH